MRRQVFILTLFAILILYFTGCQKAEAHQALGGWSAWKTPESTLVGIGAQNNQAW